MNQVEAFCEGKYRDKRNEDRYFVGAHHAAVIDGSSAAEPIDGRAGGIVAAEAILGIVEALTPGASIGDFERAAQSELARIARRFSTASPYAAAVVLSVQRREIWRIGDCPFAIDGVWNIPDHNPHEQAFFRFRQMMAAGYGGGDGDDQLPAKLGAGISSVTRDWLKMTKVWVNAERHPFAFAALDERKAPDRFLEVWPLAREARSIVLASDGAVVSSEGQRGPASVDDMLAQIELLRSLDPHCLDAFPYWRGFLPVAPYLDDTTLLSLAM